MEQKTQLDRRVKLRKIRARRITPIVLAAFIIWMYAGCTYKGMKITDGTELSIGLNVPATEGVGQLSILNYVSGFRIGVASNARVDLTYSKTRNNSFLGCVTLAETNSTHAVIEPCADFSSTNEVQSVVVDE